MQIDLDEALTGPWRLAQTTAGLWPTPVEIDPSARWIEAEVPGTVAASLEAAGLFDRAQPVPLHHLDHWYVTEIAGRPGPATLVFEGLATIAEIWLDGVKVLTSTSMFMRHEVAVTLSDSSDLLICFRALAPHFAKSGPRARWRPQMMSTQGLRLTRHTALGHMPGWCPEIHAVGPWRAVSVRRSLGAAIEDLRITAGFNSDGKAELDVSFLFSGRPTDLRLFCAGWQSPVMATEEGRLAARLIVPNAKPWWPNGMGEPHLYDVFLQADGFSHRIARTGFRTIGLDTGPDGNGFSLIVNGVPAFARGAVWTNADIARLPADRDACRPFLEQARAANMNMIRVGGTMVYEADGFYELCDEYGLMVWQEAMLANFDYPDKDEELVGQIRAEIEAFLTRTQASPSLTVFCGGSEMAQQAAMMGLPERMWYSPIITEIIPDIVTRLRPDIAYAPNSPFGGAMPFSPDTAATHYYGVGAYCRPLEDARRAAVRFASECLAFSHVPARETLERHLAVPGLHDPRWKARVPRDRGASWDFEDIREHYLETLYGFDAARLRREDPEAWLDWSRQVTGEVIAAVIDEWRRPGSTCRGALLWTLQDLLPGAGWGLIDATGRAKPVLSAVARAFSPLRIILMDEGTNGLDIHVVNDGPEPVEADLSVEALREGRVRVVGSSHPIALDPFSAATFAATTLFGAFFDTTYAFRFGPPAHDVTVARLVRTSDGARLADAFHYPLGRVKALRPAELSALKAMTEHGLAVTLTTESLAQGVSLHAEGFATLDNHVDLAPRHERIVTMLPVSGVMPETMPAVELRQLGTAIIKTV